MILTAKWLVCGQVSKCYQKQSSEIIFFYMFSFKCKNSVLPIFLKIILVVDLPILIPLVPSHHPLNLTEQVLGPTSFRLRWNPPPVEHHNGVIQSYNVNVTEIETGRKLRYSTQSTAIVIRDLHPFYLYNCTVTAVTVGEGPSSAIIGVRTEEAGNTHF